MSETSFPKNRIKVLLLENVHPRALEVFGAETFQVEAIKGSLSTDELRRKVADVHILGIRSKTQITADILQPARRLLTLGCFCIGTNQVDLEEANRRGVPVFNAPFSNTRSVAELIIAEIIMLSRQLGDRSREVHDGAWQKTASACHEIRGKHLGIVGYGHIGRQLGVLAEALGMHVMFYDTGARLPMGNNVAVSSLSELLGKAEFVSLHVPETPRTRNMIGPAELAAMQPGSYLLNASRGTVVVIPALVEALRSGHLGGAAIDVYPEEPEANIPAGFETTLRGLPNVILTPHIGGSTLEAQAAIGYEVSTSLTRFINTGATSGAVNFPQVEIAPTPGAHRILNVHRNVPGVMRDINKLVSDFHANIQAQVLATDASIGYVVMDVDNAVSEDLNKGIAALETSIRTRILY